MWHDYSSMDKPSHVDADHTLLLQLFSTVKKKKHSNGIRTGLNFECSNASNAISNAVPRKNAFHSYEECNPFEILECIQVRKSETQEWHSNIRMENGGPFECIRMFIPRTCGSTSTDKYSSSYRYAATRYSRLINDSQ